MIDGCRIFQVMPLCCHSRISGNGLFQPLDSGLRRNDGGAIVPLEQLQTFSSKSIPQNVEIKVAGMRLVSSSSFQRKLESSGLDKPFPQSGNDDTQARQPDKPSSKICHPFIPQPPF